MPRGKCHFQDLWLEETQSARKLWLRKGNDVFTAFCTLCKKTIDVSHSGVSALTSHEKGKKHLEIVNNLTSGKQTTIHSYGSRASSDISSRPTSKTCLSQPVEVSLVAGPSTSSSCDFRPTTAVSDASTRPALLSSFLLSDSVTKAEILWAAYCVTSHTSTRCGGTAVSLFPQMFPDSNIASKLKMQKDKIAYSVTYGLGPYFSKVVLSNVKRSTVFALSIDECLNDVCQKQQLDIVANYWDIEEDCVKTKYLSSLFLEKTTANDLMNALLGFLNNSNLSMDKLVQLATDGPNVNLKLIYDVNSHMKTITPDERQMLDTGTCSLHIINGAYKTAHNKVKWNVNTFLRCLYNLFKNYPSRRATYKNITGSSLFPKKFCSVRWTENSAVLQRSIDMLPHLNKFVKEIEKRPETENFVVVKEFLTTDRTIEAKLHFSAMIALELEEFLTLFQKNAPLFPFLYQEVFFIMKSIGSKFLKSSVLDKVNSGTKLCNIDLECSTNFRSLDSIEIGFGAKSSLKKVKEVDVQIFKMECKNFLIELFKKLVFKSPLKRRVVLGATCLSPCVMASETLRESRVKIAIEEMVQHNQLSPAVGDIVKRAYLKLCNDSSVQEKLKSFNWKKVRLDSFFSNIFQSYPDENANKHLLKFIQNILVCFHGNAAVERSFSFNKNFLVENLEENSLVAQRHLHDHICSLPEGVTALEVNKPMILEFRNASARRNDDLKANKKTEEEDVLAKKRAALEIKDLQLKKQKLLEEKNQELKDIDNKLKFLKQLKE